MGTAAMNLPLMMKDGLTPKKPSLHNARSVSFPTSIPVAFPESSEIHRDEKGRIVFPSSHFSSPALSTTFPLHVNKVYEIPLDTHWNAVFRGATLLPANKRKIRVFAVFPRYFLTHPRNGTYFARSSGERGFRDRKGFMGAH
uniref:Uncharacterized protein n=1 Tax=Candidatus Kentrum sp. TUN TaxID=2126343 RepID=A0A450ZQL7_9GAMM|nr:MAG: hypothetical protein BECKTUN1418D_GA0071000_10408 [Candidatus Kentron sp. TUN]